MYHKCILVFALTSIVRDLKSFFLVSLYVCLLGFFSQSLKVVSLFRLILVPREVPGMRLGSVVCSSLCWCYRIAGQSSHLLQAGAAEECHILLLLSEEIKSCLQMPNLIPIAQQ